MKKRCFVIMGFGTKTDLATGRKLNLDKSYHALIKPVLTAKGIDCVRADEIPNAGPIDVPMYKELYTADIVIADLSTANLNAFYELGIRYGLRPRTTIVMSEDQFCFPFDMNHIKINKYTHLGDSIDYFEVLRFQKVLAETVDFVLNENHPDSPVYTFLDGLIPPALQQKAQAVANKVEKALSEAQSENSKTGDKKDEQTNTLAEIIRQGENALKNKHYDLAKGLFNSALLISNCNMEERISSGNAYLIHRLALATYKTEIPNKLTALREANALLEKLDLAHTNDSETVVLGGAVEKRLYEIGEGEQHLSNAILFYQRGYYLLNNRYNGINLAYLLNCRVNSSLDETEEEKIADMVWANRIRKDVLAMCEKDWNAIAKRENSSPLKQRVNEELSKTQHVIENEQKFWITVNKAEANLGLGNMDEYKKAVAEAEEIEHEDWMMRGFTKQAEELGKLMKKYGYLINIKWNESKVLAPA
jgi:hypothetical protein